MIFSPTAKDFRISQGFGGNYLMYKKYGLIGHDGEDIAVPVGTPIYAPIDGLVTIGDQGHDGFGKYVRVIEDLMGDKREVTLAHLSRIVVKPHQFVRAKDLIGYSGNTGNSTGPHLHWQLRRLNPDFTVKNYNNGYKGSENIFGKKWIQKHDGSVSIY